jgi:hypothetical protein
MSRKNKAILELWDEVHGRGFHLWFPCDVSSGYTKVGLAKNGMIVIKEFNDALPMEMQHEVVRLAMREIEEKT